MNNDPNTMMVKASEIHDETDVVIGTGIEELDRVMGELKGGQNYLLYGDEAFLNDLVHRLLVKGASRGIVAYMNNTDYHTAKTLLDLNSLAGYAKMEGVEPMLVMKNVYFTAAYNEFRQPKAADALIEKMINDGHREDGEEFLFKPVLLVAHNITRFLDDAKNIHSTFQSLDATISKLCRYTSSRSIINVITGEAATAPRGRVPAPRGSSLLKQLANVCVFFRRVERDVVQATLVKHPERKTPVSIIISKGGNPLMGRMTPSFRQVYLEVLQKLKTHYQPLLRDKRFRDAFEALVREAWDVEHAAMANSQLPLVMDAMNLTANVRNAAEMAMLRQQLEELKKELERVRSDKLRLGEGEQ
jgi:hypothetical protein